jgi:hypothetical protein
MSTYGLLKLIEKGYRVDIEETAGTILAVLDEM